MNLGIMPNLTQRTNPQNYSGRKDVGFGERFCMTLPKGGIISRNVKNQPYYNTVAHQAYDFISEYLLDDPQIKMNPELSKKIRVFLNVRENVDELFILTNDDATKLLNASDEEGKDFMTEVLRTPLKEGNDVTLPNRLKEWVHFLEGIFDDLKVKINTVLPPDSQLQGPVWENDEALSKIILAHKPK